MWLPMSKAKRQSTRPRVVLRDFSKSLPMALMRTREAVMKRFRPSLRDHDLTEQQWRVLRALEHAGPLEATELARRTVLLAPSLSRILRDLEARGLVERAAVRSDLRRARIRVSAVGARLIAAIAPDSEATYDSITRQFGRDRLNALFALLNELEQALETEAPLPGGDQRPRADSRSMRRDARKE
jgi:homoprotocatechuate degradation regulator HpaR